MQRTKLTYVSSTEAVKAEEATDTTPATPAIPATVIFEPQYDEKRQKDAKLVLLAENLPTNVKWKNGQILSINTKTYRRGRAMAIRERGRRVKNQ